MNTRLNPADAISAHQSAVLVDEASFDDDGNARDAAQAEKTGNAERAALIEFVSAPCTSPDEVQTKVRYLLDGAIGERASLLDYLFEYGADLEDGLLTPFLRSLVLADAPRGSRTCAGTRAEEA